MVTLQATKKVSRTKETDNEGKRPTSKRSSFSGASEGINIGGSWRLTSDSLNVILWKRIKAKSGKERWDTQGYYSTIGQALIGLVRQGIRDTKLPSLQAVQDKIAQLEQDILKSQA